MVERTAVNRDVVGSKPTLSVYGVVAQLVEHLS